MQPSVRIVLLFLVLAPALARRKRDGNERSFLGELLSAPVNNFVNHYQVTNVSALTFSSMEHAKSCTPVPEMTVKFLLKLIRLYFFYGDSAAVHYDVPLDEAPKLLNHLRWKKELPIAVYTFGWLNTPDNVYTNQIVKAYHQNGHYNLVLVDWHESGSWLVYGAAVTMVPRVGAAAAKAIQKLLDAGAVLSHVVGHSLGAQISGHLSRNLAKKPPHTIGLDPAGPLFYPTMFGCQDPIRSDDAEHVTVLHTDWNRLGSNENTGPVDFKPHDGHRLQPGCTALDVDTSPFFDYTLACSHNRAVALWCNAISIPESIVGRKCHSYEAFLNKVCKDNPTSLLSASSKHEGEFYFVTKSSPPYGKGDGGA